MTDFYLLDDSFNICGIIGEYGSLLWRRRFFDVGDFSVLIPSEKLKAVKAAKYIYHPENDETAIIEKLEYNTDKNGKKVLRVSGRMLEAILSDRVIESSALIEGTVDSVVSSVLTTYAMTGDRAISLLSLGTDFGCTETVSLQATGKSLMSFLYSLLQPYGLSYRIRYDAANNKLKFSVFDGENRSSDQLNNSYAVFSSDFENILSDKYIFDISKYRNFAYVAGDGATTSVSLIKDGEDRRELYVNARDVRKTLDDGTPLSDTEYTKRLKQKGLERLKACGKVEHAECEIDSSSNLRYRADFDIGDICEFSDTEIGITEILRITGLYESYDDGVFRVSAVFENVGS